MALLLCGALITIVEIKSIAKANQEDQIPVVVLKHPVEAGQILSDKDVYLKKTDYTLGQELYIQDVDQVVGLSLIASMPAGTLINKALLTEKAYLSPEVGNALSSIKLSPEEALCWEISEGESLELVHISEEQILSYIGATVVKGVYTQQLKMNDSQELVPIYLLVEGDKKTIENLVRARGNGRIEVVKLN